MKPRLYRIRAYSVIAVGSALYAPALAQTPLGTNFTYQGKLEEAGAPAGGLHDLRFQLFTAAAGGAQVGSTICFDAVTVVDGLFTVPLDFGAAFDGNQRFLQVFVRADSTPGNCAGGTYTQLNPRQPLTATPYALKVPGIDGFSLNAADGSPVDALFVDNTGNVGIGTSTPQSPLEIRAPNVGPRPGEGLRIQGTLSTVANLAYASFLNGSATAIGYVGDGSNGDNNVFLASYIGDVVLGTPAGRVLTATAGGKVGIGTTSPFFQLTTVAGFPSDGIGVIGSSPNAPAFSLGAGGHGTSYLGMATDTDNFSSDAAPGDLVLLSPLGKRLLLQNGHAGSALAIVAGNVGIGTTSPGAKLDVNGTTRTEVLEITGADLAEKFPASEKLEPGMVVAIDRNNAGKLCLARGGYNRCVAGIVSGANNFSVGAVLGNLPGHEDAPPIALSGRVYVWCDASSGAIETGDLLTTSETPGCAMKVADFTRAQGAVLGKAMEPLAAGERGMVLVLVSLQ